MATVIENNAKAELIHAVNEVGDVGAALEQALAEAGLAEKAAEVITAFYKAHGRLVAAAKSVNAFIH